MSDSKSTSLMDAPDKVKREAALRATLLASTTQRLYNLIGTADQKAQVLILLNSIIVPIAFSALSRHELEKVAILAICTAIYSILMSIFSIYPKRRRGHKPDGTRNMLHFGDIGRMSEKEYLEAFQPIFNEPAKFSEEAIKDLHDISRRILLPKLFWLKLAYIGFFLGNFCAVILALYTILD